MQELDVKGMECPLPLLKAKQVLNRLNSGDTLRVMATDVGSVRDFKVFCELSGNRLLSSSESNGVYTYVLEKC